MNRAGGLDGYQSIFGRINCEQLNRCICFESGKSFNFILLDSILGAVNSFRSNNDNFVKLFDNIGWSSEIEGCLWCSLLCHASVGVNRLWCDPSSVDARNLTVTLNRMQSSHICRLNSHGNSDLAKNNSSWSSHSSVPFPFFISSNSSNLILIKVSFNYNSASLDLPNYLFHRYSAVSRIFMKYVSQSVRRSTSAPVYSPNIYLTTRRSAMLLSFFFLPFFSICQRYFACWLFRCRCCCCCSCCCCHPTKMNGKNILSFNMNFNLFPILFGWFFVFLLLPASDMPCDNIIHWKSPYANAICHPHPHTHRHSRTAPTPRTDSGIKWERYVYNIIITDYQFSVPE